MAPASSANSRVSLPDTTRRRVSAALAELMEVVGAEQGTVMTLSADERWEFVVSRGPRTRVFARDGGIPVGISAHSRRLARGHATEFRSATTVTREGGPKVAAIVRHLGIGAMASISVRVEGRTLGALLLGYREARGPRPGELRLLRLFASQIGIALDTARRLEETRARARALQVFAEIAALVAESLDVNVVLRRIAKHGARLLDSSYAHVLLLDEDSGDLVSAAATRSDSRFLNLRIPAGRHSVAQTTVRERKAQIVRDARNDPRSGRRYLKLFGPRAIACMPMIASGRLLGVLVIADTRGPREFSPEEIARAQTLANHAAVAIQHARVHADLKARERQLRELSGRVVDAHESERRRISRELHDAVGQGLAALALELGAIDAWATATAPTNVRGRVAAARKLLRETAQTARRLSAELHPGILDDLGLLPALRWYCGEIATRTPLDVSLEAEEASGIRGVEAVVFYRAVQEGLSNVLRHAGARRAWVTLTREASRTVLVVRDDGRGLPPAPRRGRPGVGLLAIRERASALGGTTRIDGPPGKGTRLVVEIPARGGIRAVA